MLKLLPYFAGVLLALFILAVFGSVTYYSFNALGLVFPGDLVGQLFGIVLFDIAALVWFLAFVSLCYSTMQYVFAGIGFLVGLTGTFGLIIIEIGINSKWLTSAEIARPLSYIFVAVLLAHLVLIYARHSSAPDVAAKISLGIDKASVITYARTVAEETIKANVQQLAAPIAAQLVQEAMYDLGLLKQDATIIDGTALSVPNLVEKNMEAQPPNFLSRVLSGLGIGARKFESSAPSVATTSRQPIPKPSAAQTDAENGAREDAKPSV